MDNDSRDILEVCDSRREIGADLLACNSNLGPSVLSQSVADATGDSRTHAVLMAPWTKGKRSQYRCYLSEWRKYCVSHNITNVSINHVLGFLTFLFYDRKLGYSALNTARSALSTILVIDSKPVGQHRLVVRFLKGAFNLRPVLRKSTVIWDPDIVLVYLRKLSPVMGIPLKILSFKLAALIWLLTGQPGQSLA